MSIIESKDYNAKWQVLKYMYLLLAIVKFILTNNTLVLQE